ncbi:Mobile element protein [hydrothermal vent metagenome]|uniref:Mobile element protein n=1 Tax=hydrothermal vent metagenome TaxID=652676 RepID=A0A3B0VG93_9ZZZZ
MTIKKRRHSAQFKFKVALEAAKGAKTRSQTASEFGVHPTQVSQWKQELLKNGKGLFEKGSKRGEKEKAAQEVALYEQIGRLKMELEWLKKKAAQFS